MRKKRKKTFISILSIIFFIFPLAVLAGKLATSQDSQDVSVGAFTIKVPHGWRSLSPRELNQLRTQYVAQSKDIYRQYSGTSDPAKSVAIAAYRIAGGAGTFVIVSFSIPPQSDLVNLLKSQASEKAEWGIRQGYIKKYFGLVSVDDKQISGFYAKFMGNRGQVQISGGMQHKRLRNTLIQLTLISPRSWNVGKATNNFSTILKSVQLTK